MRVRRILFLRTILYMLAAITSILSGFILVRRLSILDYAVYQTVNKRVRNYVQAASVTLQIWFFRDSLRSIPGTLEIGFLAGSLLGAVGGVIAGALVYGLTHSTAAAALAFTAMLAYSLWQIYWFMLDSLRPVRVGVVRLITRLSYGALVLALVYYLGRGLIGALASLTLGYLLGLALILASLRGRLVRASSIRSAIETMRHIWGGRVRASLYRFLRLLLKSLDVMLAIPLAGSLVVAAFFAMNVIGGIIYESFLAAMSFLQSAGLRGAEKSQSYRALRLSLLIVTPLLTYASIYHVHIAYLINPKYAWASPLILIVSAAVLLDVTAAGIKNILLGEIRGLPLLEEARVIGSFYKRIMLPSPIYLGVLLTLLLATRGNPYHAAIAWALSLLAYMVLDTLLTITFRSPYNTVSPRECVSEVYKPFTLYLAAAIVASLLSPPSQPPSPHFISEVLILLRPGLQALALYAAIILVVSGEARQTLRQAIRDVIG